MPSEREQQLEAVLSQFLKPIKGIPFEVIIKSLCEKSVIKFNAQDDVSGNILQILESAMTAVCDQVRSAPIQRPRPNEVGNDLEAYVIRALSELGLTTAAPRTEDGKGKSTGYPDIEISMSPIPIYLEVKSYAAKSLNTTLRSFYLSPSHDPKVVFDAHHLLVGFEVERNGNSYHPVAFEIVDLYGLQCDMKAEFNSDNRRLYSAERVLVRRRIG